MKSPPISFPICSTPFSRATENFLVNGGNSDGTLAHQTRIKDAQKATVAVVTGCPERLVRISTVIFRTGLSRTTIYRKIAEGTFPRQVQIAARSSAWRESQLEEWIADPLGYRG
ncbi:helix-turn-helix transcriptional regulator [Sphingopyxis sp.]|uniref:helix-turn-helix transcriptional regulator n=1 Tax=Sphingopyxis sp. TaxID=1908224 RepID=UPI002FC6842E